MTLRATALDLRSEDYESNTYKPFLENPCCYPCHGCLIDTFTTDDSQQSDLTKMAAVNFLASKMKQQKLDPVLFFTSVGSPDVAHITDRLLLKLQPRSQVSFSTSRKDPGNEVVKTTPSAVPL